MGRKYIFSWDLVGDLEKGRPNLGPNIRLEVYRLLQYTIRDVLEREYGSDKADHVLYEAGYLAGRSFYKQFFGYVTDFGVFIRDLQFRLRSLGIGVLRVEEADKDSSKLVITISEDADCSGLPESDEQVCTYDEGFIAGLLESFSGRRYKVREIDCWCTGDRTCRFTAEAVDDAG